MSAERAAPTARAVLLTIQAWLGLVAFDVARLAGFSRVHRTLRRRRTNAGRQPSCPSAAEIVWAVDEACVWYVRRAACLQRSVVATWLLRQYGIDAELVIGCRPLPFESHAWVEVDGEVVNDHPQYQKHFTVLDRI